MNRKCLTDAEARGPAESASTIMALVGDLPEHHDSANAPDVRTFGPERKLPVERSPGRATSGGEWKHRALDRGPSAWGQRLPTDNALGNVAGAPEREPASCNANMGERAAGGW